jgi:hypothetical protein
MNKIVYILYSLNLTNALFILYIFYLILAGGRAWLIEPNLAVLTCEFAASCMIVVLNSMYIFFRVYNDRPGGLKTH